METIKNIDGLYSFDFTPDGMVYFVTTVAIMDRKTGRTTQTTMSSLKDTLKAKDFERINADLLMNNEFKSNQYHIVGIA